MKKNKEEFKKNIFKRVGRSFRKWKDNRLKKTRKKEEEERGGVGCG